MTNFRQAFREYYHALTIIGTKTIIFYTHKRGYEVSWYFKESTIIDKMKAEVIYG